MPSYFVCYKDCTFAGQRWYPGDKLPINHTKDGQPPKYFMIPNVYEEKKKDEAETQHNEEVKNRLDAIRTDDPMVKKMTQDVLNRTLGKKEVKVDKPLADGWKEAQSKTSAPPPVAGPQPGSLISEKRGPGRPPKNPLDKILGDE